MSNQAFGGIGNNVVIAATTASANAALPGAGGDSIRVINRTANVAFFRVGNGAQTAVLTDTPVGPGNTEVFSIPPDPAVINNVAVILEAGAAGGNVYFQRGGGM